MILLTLLSSVFGALIDTDGSMLFDPGQSLSTLVMFTHSSCQQCLGLRPHLEKMQEQLHADGAAVLLTAIDVEAHPTVPNLVGVQYFPTFALFPAGGISPPKVFEGTSLRPLVRWLLEQLASLGAYRPSTRVTVARDATLHPAAVDVHALGMKRAPPLSAYDDAPSAGGGGSAIGAVHVSRPASWVDVAPVEQPAARRWESMPSSASDASMQRGRRESTDGGSGDSGGVDSGSAGGGGGGSDGGGSDGDSGDSDGGNQGRTTSDAGDGSSGPKGSMPSSALDSSAQPQHAVAPTAINAASGSLASTAADPVRPHRADARGRRRGPERDVHADAILLGGMLAIPLLYLAYSYAMRPNGDAAKMLLRDSAAVRRPPSRMRTACTRLEAAAALASERCREVIDAAAVRLLTRVEAWLEGGAGRERRARPT